MAQASPWTTHFEDADGKAALRQRAVPHSVTHALSTALLSIPMQHSAATSKRPSQAFALCALQSPLTPIKSYLGKPLVEVEAPPALRVAAEWVEAALPGFKPTAVIVNVYENGLHGRELHQDNVTLFQDKRVLTLVVGEARTFRVAKVVDPLSGLGPVVAEVPSGEGHALLMDGEAFQDRYRHAIVTDPSVTRQRASFTFRAHSLASPASAAEEPRTVRNRFAERFAHK